MKNFIYYLIAVVILNIYINLSECVTLEDVSDPIYYIQTPWGVGVSYTKCNSIFYLYVSTDSLDPIYQVDVTNGKAANVFTQAQNQLYTQAVYGIVVGNFDFGDYFTTIEVRINSINYYHTFNYSCINVDFTKIQYEIVEPLKYDYATQFFSTLIKFIGLNYTIPYIETTSIATVTRTYDNIYSVNFYTPPDPDFISDWNVQLVWNYQPSITLYFPSPFNLNLNNSIGAIKRYPDEGIIPSYFGMYSVACFSFLSTVKTQFIPPYFKFVFQYGEFYNYLPVYGTLGNYTYLAPLVSTSKYIYNEKELQYGEISLSTQEYNQFQEVYSGELEFYFYYLNSTLSGSIKYSQNSTNLLLSFNPIVKDYSHTPIRVQDDYGMMTVPWPYGHGMGNLKQFNLDISLSRSSPRSIYSLKFTIESNEVEFNNINSIAPSLQSSSTTTTIVDEAAPVLVSYNSTLLFDQVLLLQMRITDDISGVASINVFYTEYSYYSNLISGDKMDGIYEIYFERLFTAIQYYIIVTDNSGNSLYLKPGDFYKASPDGLIKLPSNIQSYYVQDIQDIYFLYNYVDTSGKSYFNKMFIKFKDNKITQGSISVSFSFTYSYSYQSVSHLVYNSTSSLWEGYFQMPPNLQYSTVFYTIFTYRDTLNYITSTSLRDEFQLRVYSNNTDLIGPLFTSITKVLPIENTISKEFRFGWRFTISDHLNGFKQAKIMVKGDLDNSVYNFTITPNQLLKGDIWQGEYEIMISVNSSVCASMNYTITFVEMVDNYSFTTLFQQTSMLNPWNAQVYPQLNPFLNYLNDSVINSISLKCKKQLNPSWTELLSFSVSTNSIDVGSNNKVVIILFEVSEHYGLKEGQLPVVYFQSNEYDIISSQAQLYQFNDTNFKFNCSIEIPIGFAYPNQIILGLYGLVNRVGNFTGYSASSLSKKGFQYKIDTTISFPENQVILENARYTNGELWIRGRGLKNVRSISISGESFSFIPIRDPSIQTAFKVLNYQPTSSQTLVSIKASTFESTTSNSLEIPITYPVYISPVNIDNTPQQKCQGSQDNICGGPEKGICDPSVGCKCIFPWVGLDCSSKQITNIQPQPPNTLKPSFILSINQNQTENLPSSNITSSVSLVELREINVLGQVVKIHQFDSWNFSINPNTSELYYNTTIINNNLETLVQVVLRWFDNQQQVSFANEWYTIEPATMKFSMKMSEYKFSAQLNYLELILFSSIISVKEESVTCSRAKFGYTTDNCNFMKLQVDNHSLYGKFLRKSILDNHIVQLENTGFNSTTTGNTTQSYYSIMLPHYLDYIEIDPSFSVLVDYDVGYSDSDEHCSLSPNQVVTRSVALVVGLVVGGVALLALAIIFTVTLINTSAHCINIKIMFLHLKFIIIYFKVKR